MIFNSTEREGVLVMLLLITGLIVIPRFVRSGKPAFFLLPEVINIEKDSLRPVSHREISPPLELNTADSSALVRIRGIGPYYASKIIKYRQRLGGFLCRPAVERVKDESLQCRFVRWGIYRRSFKDREIQVGHHEF